MHLKRMQCRMHFAYMYVCICKWLIVIAICWNALRGTSMMWISKLQHHFHQDRLDIYFSLGYSNSKTTRWRLIIGTRRLFSFLFAILVFRSLRGVDVHLRLCKCDDRRCLVCWTIAVTLEMTADRSSGSSYQPIFGLQHSRVVEFNANVDDCQMRNS